MRWLSLLLSDDWDVCLVWAAGLNWRFVLMHAISGLEWEREEALDAGCSCFWLEAVADYWVSVLAKCYKTFSYMER